MKKKRKNPSKTITNSLIYDLANAFYFGDSLILSIALQQYYQGENICKDCDKALGMCECEWCNECKHVRCVCDLKSKEQVSKYTAKFAKNILDDKEWKKFNNSIGRIRENYKQIYGHYLDERPEYCCSWWKNK